MDISPNGKTENDTTVLCDPSTLAPGEQDVLGVTCHDGPLAKTAIKPGSGSGGTSGAVGMLVQSILALVAVPALLTVMLL